MGAGDTLASFQAVVYGTAQISEGYSWKEKVATHHEREIQ